MILVSSEESESSDEAESGIMSESDAKTHAAICDPKETTESAQAVQQQSPSALQDSDEMMEGSRLRIRY